MKDFELTGPNLYKLIYQYINKTHVGASTDTDKNKVHNCYAESLYRIFFL